MGISNTVSPKSFKVKIIVPLMMVLATLLTAVSPINARADEIKVIPGGMPYGVQLQTDGVIVVGLSPVETDSGSCNPAKEAGINNSDIITEVNGQAVNTVNELVRTIEGSGGKILNLKVLRDGVSKTLTLTPAKDNEGNYKAGIWVRDSAAGIGTITFIDPETGVFAGLGHGICDPDTGILMPMAKGSVMNATIGAVRKGKEGVPGELKGYFSGGKIGALLANTQCGTFGLLADMPDGLSDPVAVGDADEVHTGRAYILCTLDDNTVSKYSVKITSICGRDRETKNFIIEVDDERLIAKTGGIVQGMSGSPIIQDGKLVGAVTHVLISDPTQGYGIFIENMMNAARKIADNKPEL